MILKAHKKRLLTVVTEIVASELNYKMDEEGWTLREVSMISSVPQNRLTEYRNIEKYGRIISENDLARLIGGGILTVTAIIKKAEAEFPEKLSKDDRDFLESFRIYENKELKAVLVEAYKKGLDPVRILKNAIDE